MPGRSQRAPDDLASFSIIIAHAKNDPEIREAILADGSYRTIWPLIIDQNDKQQAVGDTHLMNDITREELSNTLSAIEERMDRRVERMEQSDGRRADAYRREQEARDKLYAERFEATSRRLEDRDKVIDSKLDAMNESVLRMTEKVDGFSDHLDTKVAEVKTSNRNTILAILGIVVSVGVATVLGLWGANSTIVGSASSIFQAGQQQAGQDKLLQDLLLETKAQSAETRSLLEKMKTQQAN
ncbi:hypothetical protein [Pseudomonas moraviensis]|nr:hypothetical protein [Pseudomonas moraviensis]